MFPTHRESEDVIVRRVIRRLDRVLTQLENQLIQKEKGVNPFNFIEENTGSGTTSETFVGLKPTAIPEQSLLEVDHQKMPPPPPRPEFSEQKNAQSVPTLPPLPKVTQPPPLPPLLASIEKISSSDEEGVASPRFPQDLTPAVLRIRQTQSQDIPLSESSMREDGQNKKQVTAFQEHRNNEFEQNDPPEEQEKDNYEDRMESEYEYLALERDHSLRSKSRKKLSFGMLLYFLIILLGSLAIVAWYKGLLELSFLQEWAHWLQF